MCMSKLKRIMRINNNVERDAQLKEYASKLGISTGHTLYPREYIPDILEAEKDKRDFLFKISTFIVSIIFGSGIVWSILYTFCIYPPEYTLDGSSLHFGKWFSGWINQEKKQNKEVNLYNSTIEYELHFILRNKHRGEGEVSKPFLVITAENSNKEYEIKPETSYVSSRKEGDSIISYSTIDSGRTIHVGSYGIVDEYYEYRIGYNREEKDEEIMEFLRINKDKLLFKIRGYPYKDVNVNLSE